MTVLLIIKMFDDEETIVDEVQISDIFGINSKFRIKFMLSIYIQRLYKVLYLGC